MTEHTDEGERVEAVAVIALARALSLAEGHTFADARTLLPAPNTMRIARTVVAHLAADDWRLIRLAALSGGSEQGEK